MAGITFEEKYGVPIMKDYMASGSFAKGRFAMNYDHLREDLIDYFGTALSSGFPMAVIELSDVERASDAELIHQC